MSFSFRLLIGAASTLAFAACLTPVVPAASDADTSSDAAVPSDGAIALDAAAETVDASGARDARAQPDAEANGFDAALPAPDASEESADAGTSLPDVGAGLDAEIPLDGSMPDACTPSSCLSLGAECGTLSDGCGGSIDCGVCSGALTCGADGLPGRCGTGRICDFDGWCWEYPYPQGEQVTSIWSAAPNRVWATAYARILFFDGSKWVAPPLPVSVHLDSLWGFSETDVWASGQQADAPWAAVVLHWDGWNWSSVTTPVSGTQANLRGIWGSAPNDVWIAGSSANMVYPQMLHWDGQSWTLQQLPRIQGAAYQFLQAVWGTGSTDVWAGGEGCRVAHWDGASWSYAPHALGGITSIQSLWGSSGSDIWAGTTFAETLLHNDGTSWQSVTTPMSYALTVSDVWGTGAQDVWFATGDKTYRWDGGSFSELPKTSTSGARAVFGTSASDVWLGGSGLQHFNGVVWDPPNVTDSKLTDAWWVSDADGWAVGEAGLVLRWDGSHWNPQVTPAGNDMLRSVWASSATDVWIGGTGQLLRFDGTSWTKEFPPNEVDAIWGSGPQDVWVSQSTSMLHWDGANWTSWASGLGLVSRLWGSGPLDVYAVSYFGAAHWDGMSWSPVAGLGGLEWRDVSGTSPSDVWVVGNSEMRQWDGQSWASVSTPMTCASSAYYCAVLASPGGVWASLAGALYQRQGTNWVKNGPGAATRIRIAGSTVGIIGDRRILRRYP